MQSHYKFYTPPIPFLETLKAGFNKAIRSRNRPELCKYWEDAAFKAWYCGELVNFGTPETPAFERISFGELIQHFKSLLHTCYSPIIEDMWQLPHLKAAFCGQAVNLGSELYKASFEEVVANFEAAQSNHLKFVANDILGANPSLLPWYFGQLVDLGPPGQPDLRLITAEQLKRHFRSMLASQHFFLLEKMWESCLHLRAWLTSQPLIINATLPPFPPITENELIDNFKAIVTSRNNFILKEMWSENVKLKEAIKNLSVEKSQELFHKVLSGQNKTITFLKDYIEWFDNVEVITNVLRSIKTNAINSDSIFVKQLEMRLRKLSPNTILAATPPNVPVPEKTLNFMQETGIRVKRKKRKNEEPPIGIMTWAIPKKMTYSLDGLGDKLPSLAAFKGETAFEVDIEVSEKLSTLSKEELTRYGIKHVRKVPGKNQYKITVNNIPYYETFRLQHMEPIPHIEPTLHAITLQRNVSADAVQNSRIANQSSSAMTFFNHSYNSHLSRLDLTGSVTPSPSMTPLFLSPCSTPRTSLLMRNAQASLPPMDFSLDDSAPKSSL